MRIVCVWADSQGQGILEYYYEDTASHYTDYIEHIIIHVNQRNKP